ncbi:D-glycero-alpha-D-manno-heptose-7-phosphate kinase [Parabacteroides sp. PF5-5]|uniref:GHMP family kinase ATP-binding protein n=1 Tax=unclassified Parabacteroides TaxID=2649774 RepID=UPI0024758B71|nr:MULTISPECIES: dehydrogenase [unclassified Parabacteroides]MDH6306797.1 D-glycero-alpha-D-manno-heptose-7-phosphate kinase [Parabacteroides sp. PH5-39]MDH6317683.1 D-glycero-alpha-D-manno-heptose-7-phosphate kinase [Parabacteroides sp. PF5-13]MDH6321509.1 D-glycero-alpha-D-manno-heptose-7-phosphate kinase [Parabacteroides sp. PH5-13]MDH6325214.1 D-glycero-alpha-D-manno-heptose-7-phosphate kinase [Parabacteroides sp. PH5-8]MDH6328868.1 D-glycero-alpha-D-manno-heptose-7-phosphate kinase [Parab
MLYRSKAPFRLGIAGGGTDVSPYSDIYGGAILNVTVSLYAYATIRPLNNGKVRLVHVNDGIVEEMDATERLPLEGSLLLQRGIYNSIVSKYNQGKPLSFELTTSMDVPSGSGLGTSSTLVVAILGAFTEWMKLPLGKYDIAHYAYEIERIDLKMAGGKQDQYAATFGGVNFMEFLEDDKVIVNPLRIGYDILQEWAMNTVLFYTQQRRSSGHIIEEQVENVKKQNDSLEAMHKVKEEAFRMKNCLLREELWELGKALNVSWTNKKKMARHISNEFIDNIYETAMSNGALGGKISGAGGGGYMFFYCPGNTCYQVTEALAKLDIGEVQQFEFCKKGLTTWTVKEQ